MILAGLAPVLAFILVLAAVRPRCAGGRTALLVAAVLWGLAVVVVTEALSLVHAVHFGALLGAWLGLSALLGGLVWRRRRARVPVPAAVDGSAPLGWIDAVLLVGAGAIAAAVGVVALAASRLLAPSWPRGPVTGRRSCCGA